MTEQMRIFSPDGFERPLKWHEGHYVPILKSLPGELRALTAASSATWDRMTPLIEATGKAGVEAPPARSTYPKLAERLAPAVRARAFFLDFPRLDTRARVNVGQRDRKVAVSVIEHIYEHCRSLGLTFIPVLAPGHDAQRASLVRGALERDGRGLCLRVPVTGIVWADDFGSSIRTLLADTGSSCAQTDLLIDLSYVPSPPGFAVRHIKRLIESLPNLDDWRSLILAGTVIPSTAAGWQEGGITELSRHDWLMYRDLRLLGPGRVPAFGDYAIQHPEPPPGGGGPGMRANIRYTTDELVLFARGYSILEHGRDQYRELCHMLVKRPEFCGATYTWGDGAIAATAVATTRPKGEPQWRSAGTSHHLRFVTESVEGL
jgi:hypothetical protein